MIIDYIDDECVFCPRENETMKTHFFDDFEIAVSDLTEHFPPCVRLYVTGVTSQLFLII